MFGLMLQVSSIRLTQEQLKQIANETLKMYDLVKKMTTSCSQAIFNSTDASSGWKNSVKHPSMILPNYQKMFSDYLTLKKTVITNELFDKFLNTNNIITSDPKTIEKFLNKLERLVYYFQHL